MCNKTLNVTLYIDRESGKEAGFFLDTVNLKYDSSTESHEFAFDMVKRYCTENRANAIIIYMEQN